MAVGINYFLKIKQISWICLFLTQKYTSNDGARVINEKIIELTMTKDREVLEWSYKNIR